MSVLCPCRHREDQARALVTAGARQGGCVSLDPDRRIWASHAMLISAKLRQGLAFAQPQRARIMQYVLPAAERTAVQSR